MHIQNSCLHRAAQTVGFQHGFYGGKRVVERAFHEHLPQDLRHQHLAALRCVKHPRAAPRCHFGKVKRPDDARFLFDELQHVFLIEGVVAQRQAICPRLQQHPRMFSGKTGALRRVLAIDHNKIKAPSLTQGWQTFGNCRPPCPPHDIAKKE